MGVTIRDLAEYCGLSVSAVSKALNGYSDISEATRQAVMNAVQELDYHVLQDLLFGESFLEELVTML